MIQWVATFPSPVNKDPLKKENVFSLLFKSYMIISYLQSVPKIQKGSYRLSYLLESLLSTLTPEEDHNLF